MNGCAESAGEGTRVGNAAAGDPQHRPGHRSSRPSSTGTIPIKPEG
jgi:hypothetical protein